jgi:death-on-curing protein
VDGNKRVAFVALELFLELHAHHLLATDAACVTEMLALDAGDRSDDDFIAWVRSHARRKS